MKPQGELSSVGADLLHCLGDSLHKPYSVAVWSQGVTRHIEGIDISVDTDYL